MNWTEGGELPRHLSVVQMVVEQQKWQEKNNLQEVLWQNEILESHSRD